MRRVAARVKVKDSEPWYTNKELYEMFQGLKDELKETRSVIKEYNGLRKLVNDLMADMGAIKSAQLERYNVGRTIREWGGWVIGLLSFCVTMWTILGRR